MTRLSPHQDHYLRQITRQRAKYDGAMGKAELQREILDEMLRKGRQEGISTYRLAEASRFSQPRVQQLTRPHPKPKSRKKSS